jgi:DnaD/phage-associated family protein
MVATPVTPYIQFPEPRRSAIVSYTRIPDAVLLDARVTPVQLRIYAVIARRADRETASAFPSYATIARDANISRRSAINGVTMLVSFGYLAKRSQESGQGDLTSNRYTISGEGSEIFAPRSVPTVEVVQNLHHGSAECAPQVVHDMHYGSAGFTPQVVQQMHHGSATAAPELDSMNKKKSNKTQDNRIAPARTHEASAAPAAADPELEALFSDFQENIGALTAVVKQVIGELIAEHNADQVRKAIQEAVIYEKRSLAYVRRVLEAWKSNGRSIEDDKPSPLPTDQIWSDFSPVDQATTAQFFLLNPGQESFEPENPVTDGPAAAWNAISSRVPELGRFARVIEPKSLTDNVLTVRVPDERTYFALTNGLSSFINRATRFVLGSAAKLQVEIAGQAEDEEKLPMSAT